jgi:tetratricopeptide (TPR) repeat protein
VQRSLEFSLREGDKKVRPKHVGIIYRREKAEGDRLLLSARYQGVEGWAPASAVIALTEAEPFFSREILQHPRDSFAFLMRGIVRFANDDTDHAIADLNEALGIDPNNVAALATRGLLWQARDRPEEALADVNKALELDARNSDVFADRGMLYSSVKQYDKALADFERSIELGSRSASIHFFTGLIHIERHEMDKASVAINHALQIDPERADVLVGLGTIHMMLSEKDEALAAFNKAIQIDPRCDTAYGQRSMLYRSLGDDDKALVDLDEAIYLNRERALYIYNHGFLMYSRAEFDRALADVETAIRLDPKDEQPHHGRAWILTTCPVPRIRNGSQAVVSATRACELTKWSEPLYLATLAAAYSETGDFASAVKWQQKAIDNLDLRDSKTEICRTLLQCYKGKKPYRTVGSSQSMGIRQE